MHLSCRAFALVLALFSLADEAAAAESAPSPHVRHVILFVADGWSQSALEAASYYHHGVAKGEPYQRWREIPMATYSAGGSYDPVAAWADFNHVRDGATDSAAAATALATGVLTTDGTVGLDAEGNRLELITEVAAARGMATGVVSSVMFFHATPAAFGARVPKRDMYQEISRQLLMESPLTVLMGAGHPLYDDEGNLREEPDHERVGGVELWHEVNAGTVGSDLDGNGAPDPWHFIESVEEFEALAAGEGDLPARVLGVPRVAGTLQANRGGDANADAYAVPLIEGVPSLATMTRGALAVLQQNASGFFLMVEGGAVDWAGHANSPGRIIEEMTAFNDAVAAASAWVEANSSWEETLIVVTGDHDCGYLMGPESDPAFQPVVNRGQGTMPGMKFNSTGHTNQLIPLFVRGPGIERLASQAMGVDPKCGPYVQIATVGAFLREMVAGP